MNEREQLLESLSFLYDGLIRIEQISSEKEKMKNRISVCEAEIKKEEKEVKRAGQYSGYYKTGSKVVIIVSVAIAMFLFSIIMGSCGLMAKSFDPVMRWPLYILGFFVFFVVGMVTVGIVLIAGGAANSANKSKVKKEQSAPQKIAAIQKELDFIREEKIPETDAKMIVAYQDIEPVVNVFPPDYLNSYAVGRVIFFIRNLRADNMKEAINLYNQEIYQEKILAEQRKQSRWAEITAKAGIISAVANMTTAYNTGKIADNTSQMVGQLRNIQYNTAQTAQNTANTAGYARNIQYNTAQAAQNTANTARYARNISNALNGLWG